MEILKMVDAKVDAEVIKAYIQVSQVAYSPSATEIIALKDRGVPRTSSRLCCSVGELKPKQRHGRCASGTASQRPLLQTLIHSAGVRLWRATRLSGLFL